MITAQKKKKINQQRRRRRTRGKVIGTAERPRMSVFRSHQHLFLQLINDDAGLTLVSLADKGLAKAGAKGKSSKVEIAFAAGQKLGELALAKGITKVAFDKGAYKYHGRVKAAAEGARLAGLKF